MVSKYWLLKHSFLWTPLRSSVQFSFSVVSDSLQICGLQHTKLPCPSPTLCPSSIYLSSFCLFVCLFVSVLIVAENATITGEASREASCDTSK